MLHDPCAQVSDLATFRAEGTPRISFPRCGLLAEGTDHGGSVTVMADKGKSLPNASAAG
ncbi:hypothetical protein COMA1_10637 [Candidatus Nitrospira nitrosa]|uniref:Uncharacterized protein n=1 Tax=Candidatus Nitrospira nitrosa TaxID=1742972 RepID=A0A0S4L4B0_9BACT|nr:hypothetical protein COMA1_10637 [Candidatus Nitrospira nitrosa]